MAGKKQGEILCFNLAYIIFAEEQNIPCLHFLLNDKKLMHDDQLIKVTDFLEDRNIQLVISINNKNEVTKGNFNMNEEKI